MDVARLLSGFCPYYYADPSRATVFFRALLVAADWSDPWETPIPKPRDTNVLLTLRTFANMLQDSTASNSLDWLAEVRPPAILWGCQEAGDRLTHILAPGGNVEGAVRGIGQAASHRAGHPFIQVRSSRFVRSVIGGEIDFDGTAACHVYASKDRSAPGITTGTSR